MYRTLLALFLCLNATALNAGPDRFSVLLGSHHINGTGFNEVNPGLFATWERERTALSLGVFINSYERVSIAATSYLPLKTWKTGDAGVFAGLAHYPTNGRDFKTHLGGDVVFLGGLQLRQGYGFVQVVPMNADSAEGLISFGLTFDVP